MQISEQVNLLEKRITELETENKNLHETVAYLTKKLYGRSSEKSKTLGIEGQLSFFDEAETEADPNVKEPEIDEVEKVIYRRKYKGQRKDKLANLPHEKIVMAFEPGELNCPQCDSQLKPVGEEFVRSEVEYIPAVLKVIDLYRQTLECRKCKHTDHPYMEKIPIPAPVISHSYASASSIAHVMYQKYVNAVPLNRQENDWKNLGLGLKRQTMSNWIMESSQQWLSPIVKLLHKKMTEGKYTHADETRIQVMKEPGRKNTTDSFMWVYGTHKESETPIRIFEYRATRNGDHAKAFLKNFKGYLIADAYQGYGKVEDVILCYCWSHVRRYFVDAIPPGIKEPGETLPGQAIKYCGALFKIEKEIENLTPIERKKERQKRSKPILDAFWKWIDENNKGVLPGSKLSSAFTYALNQKEGLMNFLLDGNIPISNNLAENSIRPFTVGRRNWLFSGSPDGATASALVYSVVETAKANGLNPYKYLLYILKYLPGSRFKENPEILEAFLPWNPQVKDYCKNDLTPAASGAEISPA